MKIFKYHNDSEQEKVIPKSRYDSIDSFLSNCCNKWDGYNDIEVYHGDDDADGEDDDSELRFTSEDCPSRTIDHSDERCCTTQRSTSSSWKGELIS